DAPGTARLAGGGVPRRRAVPQAAAPAARHQRRLPPILRPRRGQCPPRRGQPLPVADEPVAAPRPVRAPPGPYRPPPPRPAARPSTLSPALCGPRRVKSGACAGARRAGPRRSVYRFVFRTLPDPFVDRLDGADASQLCPVRTQSATAPQALALLNNPFILAHS